MPFIYSSGSASTSTESLTLPQLRRRSSNSFLQSAGTKLQSALTRHYHSRVAYCSRPRSLSQASSTTSSVPVPEQRATGGTVSENDWVVVSDEEESDEDFADRMERERQSEWERENDMLQLQMLLWRRWGHPRSVQY